MSRRRPCRTCRLRRAARPRQAQGRPARRRAQAASRRTPSVRPSPPRRPCARRPCARCSPSAGCPWRPLPRGARAARALHAAAAPAEAQGLQLSAADAGLSARRAPHQSPPSPRPPSATRRRRQAGGRRRRAAPSRTGRGRPAHLSSLPPRAATRGARMPAPWIAAGRSALPPCGWRKGPCKGHRAPRGPARPATRPDAPQPRRPAC